MKVLLDDQPVDVERPTLAAALEAGRSAAEKQGRVVIEATLDGEPIPDPLLSSPPDEPMENAQVCFTSTDPVAFVSSTLYDVADAIENAREDQSSAAELVQMGKIEDAFEHLHAAFQVWEAVHQSVLNGAALMSVSLDELSVTTESDVKIQVGESVQKLSVHLQELKRCMQDQDWSSLADVLNYEMDDQAKHWKDVLRAFAVYVKSFSRE